MKYFSNNIRRNIVEFFIIGWMLILLFFSISLHAEPIKVEITPEAASAREGDSNTASVLIKQKNVQKSPLNTLFKILKTEIKSIGKIEVARIEFSLPEKQYAIDSSCNATAEVNVVGGTAKLGVDYNFEVVNIHFETSDGRSKTKVIKLDVLKGEGNGDKTVQLQAAFSSNEHCPINARLQNRNYEYNKITIILRENRISAIPDNNLLPASKSPEVSIEKVISNRQVNIRYNITGNTELCTAIYPLIIKSETTASEDQYEIDLKANLMENPVIFVKILEAGLSDTEVVLAAQAEGCELATNDKTYFTILGKKNLSSKSDESEPEDELEKECNALKKINDQEKSLMQQSFLEANCKGEGRVPNFEPEEVAVQATSVFQATGKQLQNIRSRLNTLRATKGKRGIDVSGVTLNVQGESISAGLFGGSAGDNENELLENSRWGFFANGDYSFGDSDQIKYEDKKVDRNFNFNSTGLTIGADYRFSGEKEIAGVAIGYKDFASDFTAQEGNSNLKGYNVNLYGTYLLSDQAYLDATVGYGKDKIDSCRPINNDGKGGIGNKTTFAIGKPDTEALTFSAGGGYEFHQDEWSLIPYGRMDYTKGTISAYNESASHPSAISGLFKFKQQNIEALTSTMGAKVSRVISTSSGVFVPYASVEWKHEFKEQDAIAGTFFSPTSEAPKPIIENNRNELDKDYYNFGIGVSAQLPKGKSAFLELESRQGDLNKKDTAARAGFRWEF